MYDEKITVRFPREVMQVIRETAQEELRQPSNFIAWAVIQYLKQNYREDKDGET